MNEKNPILFGANVDPNANQVQTAFEHARIADTTGYDLITIQDHPYNKHFLDTWTLLSALAAVTERVHLGTNVANLPLRPPAMLAKQAASLDLISNGRMELGLGAGAFWQGVAAYGGPERSGKEAYEAFKEAVHIMRAMWKGGSVKFDGTYYQVKGALAGPVPTRNIPIWVGGLGPKMLNFTGQMADGVLLSITYVPPENLTWANEQIDAGAAEAGRPTTAIRRGYNVMGAITANGKGSTSQQSGIIGPVSYWVDTLQQLNEQYRQDTFIFWPVVEDKSGQFELFANQVIPNMQAAQAK
ncbi:MAG: hypothetical protein OHK0046_42460 [Anaerolineae bacterium]